MDDTIDDLIESGQRLRVYTAWLPHGIEGNVNDRLWRADRASLLTALVVRAVQEFDIDLTQMHNDTTTVTLLLEHNGNGAAFINPVDGQPLTTNPKVTVKGGVATFTNHKGHEDHKDSSRPRSAFVLCIRGPSIALVARLS